MRKLILLFLLYTYAHGRDLPAPFGKRDVEDLNRLNGEVLSLFKKVGPSDKAYLKAKKELDRKIEELGRIHASSSYCVISGVYRWDCASRKK